MPTGDQQLWQAFQRGDRHAFLTLYDQYFPVLIRYCRQLTPAAQLIEDTIHDFFIYLWDRREHLGQVRAIQPYLIASMRRRMLKQLKKASLEALPEQLPSPPFSLVVHPTLSVELQQALQALTEPQREALFLKFYNNLTYQEVAEVMDLKADTVYKMVKRSLHKLKKGMLITGLASLSTLTGLLTLAGITCYDYFKILTHGLNFFCGFWQNFR